MSFTEPASIATPDLETLKAHLEKIIEDRDAEAAMDIVRTTLRDLIEYIDARKSVA